ncbi:MAG: beta-N-acetylhexosaminidase [Chromatiales bacterium]
MTGLGPLMLDLQSPTLGEEERERLQHPLVGGVILFTRNYGDRAQLAALVAELHALRSPPLLVAVDHEGGHVQRFRDGFTVLPACAAYGRHYAVDRRHALASAEAGGWLMAAELRAVGVDFSFAPVLDVEAGVSGVIGDRAFHRDPHAIAALAYAFMSGMHAAGMAAVGKHFPGHGRVEADSHLALPVDTRALSDIESSDLIPFAHLVRNGIEGIMPAHVLYPAVDDMPAGFSAVWLKQILRVELGFHGAVFSDDVSMAAAARAGGITERARTALAAGCDMVLVCNDPHGAATVLRELEVDQEPIARVRMMRMHGRGGPALEELLQDERWQRARRVLATLEETLELDLRDDPQPKC